MPWAAIEHHCWPTYAGEHFSRRRRPVGRDLAAQGVARQDVSDLAAVSTRLLAASSCYKHLLAFSRRQQQLFFSSGLIMRRALFVFPWGVSPCAWAARGLPLFLLCLSLACTVPQLLAKKKDKAASSPDEQRRALHALNRLTFGPRPGDVQQVMAMGVEQWIELQLHPEKSTIGRSTPAWSRCAHSA